MSDRVRSDSKVYRIRRSRSCRRRGRTGCGFHIESSTRRTNMNDIGLAFGEAFGLIGHLDTQLVDIVVLSLEVSFAAVVIAAVIGLPLGAVLAVKRFTGRHAIVVFLNALMGLPPVVVGLLVYLLLSRAGPLGALGLLFTPQAMGIAQTVLIVPIVAALTRQVIEDGWHE